MERSRFCKVRRAQRQLTIRWTWYTSIRHKQDWGTYELQGPIAPPPVLSTTVAPMPVSKLIPMTAWGGDDSGRGWKRLRSDHGCVGSVCSYKTNEGCCCITASLKGDTKRQWREDILPKGRLQVKNPFIYLCGERNGLRLKYTWTRGQW